MITRRFKDTGQIGAYLKRHFIFQSKYLTIFLHQFWASDPDDSHDHPWDSVKIRLKGDYTEYNVDGTSAWRTPGSVTYRRAEDFHRIELGDGGAGAGWSLFIHFKRRRKWGFLYKGEWMEAGKYGELVNNPVEINGVDYVVRGTFFPKIKWLDQKAAQVRWEHDRSEAYQLMKDAGLLPKGDK
jgi:hypothetical protein